MRSGNKKSNVLAIIYYIYTHTWDLLINSLEFLTIQWEKKNHKLQLSTLNLFVPNFLQRRKRLKQCYKSLSMSSPFDFTFDLHFFFFRFELIITLEYHIQSTLVIFGLTWSNSVLHGPLWSYLVYFGLIRFSLSTLVLFGPL